MGWIQSGLNGASNIIMMPLLVLYWLTNSYHQTQLTRNISTYIVQGSSKLYTILPGRHVQSNTISIYLESIQPHCSECTNHSCINVHHCLHPDTLSQPPSLIYKNLGATEVIITNIHRQLYRRTIFTDIHWLLFDFYLRRWRWKRCALCRWCGVCWWLAVLPRWIAVKKNSINLYAYQSLCQTMILHHHIYSLKWNYNVNK